MTNVSVATGLIVSVAGLSVLCFFLSGRKQHTHQEMAAAMIGVKELGNKMGRNKTATLTSIDGLLKAAGSIAKRLLPRRVIKWCRESFPLEHPPWGLTGDEAAGMRILLAAIAAALGILVFKITFLGLFISATLGTAAFFLPSLAQGRERKKFVRSVEQGLPQVADLMYASLLGGKSVFGALKTAAYKGAGPAGELFRRACKELSMGIHKEQAFGNMLRACPSRDLSLLLHSLLRSEKYGYSITETLKIQADHLRFKDRAYRKSQAYKTPLKMMVPLVFLILPASIILIIGPVILNVISRLS